MENRQAIVGEVRELDFTEMVLKHLDGDEFSLAKPFLEKARMVMIEKTNFHSGIANECKEAVYGLDRLIAAANEQLGHEKEQEIFQEHIADQEGQEAVQEPLEADISEVRCGNAAASDISHCKKYRHALAPIARLNGGFLELQGATKLIMTAMNATIPHNSMKGSLSKYMRGDPQWERINKGLYKLLEVGGADDSASEVIDEELAGGNPVLKAA